jgi:hypothetical protein
MIQANLLLSRPFIKINACLIGYGLWMLLSQHQIIIRTIQAPVCFYKIAEHATIIAPDNVNITIKASKKNLEKFDAYNSAIHIDASDFQPGNNLIILQKENLFLPDEIKLVNLLPSSLQIQLQKKELLL